MNAPAATAVARWPFAALAALFLAFAAYGSFVPFDLKRVSLEAAIARFAATPFVPISQASKTDLLTNVLLFVPIGFFLLAVIAPSSRRVAALVWPVVVLAGLAFATAIEFGQIFVSGRTPSWNDVAAETTGAAAGGALWLAAGPHIAAWFRAAAASTSPDDRVYRVLGIYAALWLVLGLLPFDYTVRPQELAEKFRAGRIQLQPFGPGTSVADVIGTFVMAVPVGAFAYYFGRTRPQPILTGLAVVSVVTAVVEFAQLLAVSRIAAVTDILVNLIGGAGGVWLAGRATETPGNPRPVRLWPIAALVGWSVLLAARHWAPFDFAFDGYFLRSRLDLMFRVPFHSYYWGMPLFAFAEAATKFLLGVPVGALWQLICTRDTGRGRLIHSTIGVVGAAALFTVIEFGQLALPSRVPDQTDILIALCGALSGIAVVRMVATNVSLTDEQSCNRSE